MSRAAFFAFVPSFPGFVGADGSVRPAKHASETRKSSANSQLPLGGQGRPPLHRLGGFCVTGLDIWRKSDILKITRVLPANEQFPYKVIKEVTAIFVRDGRLLLFAVTDLDNEADHTDHKNTKLK